MGICIATDANMRPVAQFGAAIRNEQDVRATEHIGITEQYLTVRARSARATIKRKTSGHPVALAMTDEQVYLRRSGCAGL